MKTKIHIPLLLTTILILPTNTDAAQPGHGEVVFLVHANNEPTSEEIDHVVSDVSSSHSQGESLSGSSSDSNNLSTISLEDADEQSIWDGIDTDLAQVREKYPVSENDILNLNHSDAGEVIFFENFVRKQAVKLPILKKCGFSKTYTGITKNGGNVRTAKNEIAQIKGKIIGFNPHGHFMNVHKTLLGKIKLGDAKKLHLEFRQYYLSRVSSNPIAYQHPKNGRIPKNKHVVGWSLIGMFFSTSSPAKGSKFRVSSFEKNRQDDFVYFQNKLKNPILNCETGHLVSFVMVKESMILGRPKGGIDTHRYFLDEVGKDGEVVRRMEIIAKVGHDIFSGIPEASDLTVHIGVIQ